VDRRAFGDPQAFIVAWNIGPQATPTIATILFKSREFRLHGRPRAAWIPETTSSFLLLRRAPCWRFQLLGLAIAKWIHNISRPLK